MTETTPLLFSHVLDARRLDELSAPHGLTQADLDWLHHAALPNHSLRAAQTPPMSVETILFEATGRTPIPLAGCLSLTASPATGASQAWPAFLYTPQGGIRKFASRRALETKIEHMLASPVERDDLFQLLSISQRAELNGSPGIRQTRSLIEGDVFEALVASIEHAQSLNARTMVDELMKLPSLQAMLDQVLNEAASNFDHRQGRVAISTYAGAGSPTAGRVINTMSLADAVLVYFHHQGRPSGHDVEFIHPGITPSSGNARQWENLLKVAAGHLIPRLIQCIEGYWDATGPFHISRRKLLSQVLSDTLRANILIQREQRQLTHAQSRELFRVLGPSGRDETLLFIETVRLWEYEPLYVELAGSLMISGKGHYLYTPSHGLQKVDDYLSFKQTLLGTPTRATRKEALYGLLSLEERNRFLRLDEPKVSGHPVALPVFESLANTIIGKQTSNLHYALEMSRQGKVDLHALVDKALDIRTLIDKSLLKQGIQGHWGAQPVFYGDLRPSNFMADQLERKIKSYASVEEAFTTLFARVPMSSPHEFSKDLRALLPKLTNVFSLGIRAEAELRELDGTLPPAAHDLIRTVFAYDPDFPDRTQRMGVKGFRPDVYSLRLTCTDETRTVHLCLANCFFLTERGGLDTPYSGLGILWTPSDGLQVFSSVEMAAGQLNRYLLDPRRRFSLLENLPAAQRKPHGHYRLEAFELIEDNVLSNRMSSFIDLFEAEHRYLSSLKIGPWKLSGMALAKSLEALQNKGAPTNLPRAMRIAQANRWRQKLPAWLGTAALEDQRLHIDLLDQYKSSVADGKDYLDGIEPLRTYVGKKLKALLDARLGEKDLDPASILITPNLALAGPPASLIDFALNHVEFTQKTGLHVSSTSGKKLPDSLNEATVKQMLLSLDISTSYKKHVRDKLSGTGADAEARKQRFRRQLPWQLLQHAHARHLQQYLSATAFDLIRQVLDMPDGIARQAVKGASALIRPLELITTGGAAAVKTLGLYLIGSSTDATAPHVLYAPYRAGPNLIEFKDEASLIAALNLPGALQDLLISRLPTTHQGLFRNLFVSTLGKLSDITLASNPIQTNLLDTLFNDNLDLLSDLLSTQTDRKRQFDWQTVLHLFSTGVRFAGRQLPGKLTFFETLWESYQDFKASAEALRQHDWKTGLHDFIAGAAEMVSLGMLNRDDTFGLLAPASPATQVSRTTTEMSWKDIASTAPTRTNLHAFEATDASLFDLHANLADGTYGAAGSGKLYASVAGRVFQVAKANQVWRVVHAHGEGPILARSSDDQQWAIDPQRHTIRYGKVMSTLANSYSDYQAGASLNIEARGMAEIRRKYPHHANAIVQALETARFYSINALHNLEHARQQRAPASRLETFLQTFLGVEHVDAGLIEKVHTAIAPICRALADPSWEAQNAKRIVIGNLKDINDIATAFVVEPNAKGRIYLTQLFFEIGLDRYQELVPQSFNVDAHAQGATLIHELTHQLFDTYDIVYLDASLPFFDLISQDTEFGRRKSGELKEQQLKGFSLGTPRSKLFMAWDHRARMLKSLEQIRQFKDMTREILKITGATSISEARDIFLDPASADKRIDLILRNADSMTLLICMLGRQLDAVLPAAGS
ncbi:hypothetical protein SAMN03159507_04884 [Pseudomonas sp. NFACC32-1]|uniref:dermonecrotic toxin domain-containing protein n=1 Tax=unclassified Pseudomonas TaxID=196821 RepID=UPI000876B7F6|nr:MULTISPECIES: DUF6543 domain-containing protein [unclassified Pseudomonas]MDB6445656.1 hypothetical protein [Pseudomonas sp. 21TX0197]SCX72012.1 hypothetical protein SAMN03159507_04884 [Pseudomonas sp. NFACC32-1]